MLQEGGKPQPSGYFRLPVDRGFALQGHGLIVTGTAQSGEIRVGDRVRCLPGDEYFRVRSIQVHNAPVETGMWGQRIALNLSGQESTPIERGHVICHENITRTSDRFDAFLEVRPAAAAGIKNHQRVRVHLGTAERMGKLILLGSQETVGPKESAYCQITVSEAVLAYRRDRFVVRDETSSRTLAGGVVIHPWSKKHKRHEPGLQAKLQLLHRGDLAGVAAGFLDESPDFALSITPLQEFLNLREETARELISGMETVRVLRFEGEKLYTTQSKWERASRELLQRLRDYHAAHPLAPGMEMEEVRDRLPYDVAPRVFRAFLEELEREKLLVRDANRLRVPEHKVRLRDEERALTERIKALLGNAPLAPPELKEIETKIGVGRARLGEVIGLMERERSIVRVSGDMVFLADCVETVKQALRKYLSKNAEITPSSFRELFGTSRKYTIPLLEYFDREGITIRVGDARRLKGASPAGSRS